MDQIDKNTVKAKGQLKAGNYVTFFQTEGEGKRVMFVGNSITRHGILHDIGWHQDWGMAASDISKDYVHLLAEKLSSLEKDPAFCVCQVAAWERDYKTITDYSPWEPARDFGADLIFLRLIENAPKKEFDPVKFKEQLHSLRRYLDPTGKAQIIIGTSFWKHVGDPVLTEYAKEQGIPLIYMGDLGEDDENKAIGLFEHDGVASHPGDLGMQRIADRFFECYMENR